jgi:membrane-bound lytic murein transglycosylase D
MFPLKVFLLVIGSVLLFFVPGGDSALAPGTAAGQDTAQQLQRVHSFPLPDKLAFAGEEVPLTDPDIRERLEREIIQNCYKHSATLLILKREGRWKTQLQTLLKENGLHEDFFYLSVAESELDEHAASPVGAVGFWQFMKATAGEFGLEVSAQVDQRKDPVVSTVAACKYLKQAYSKFGNWTLTAASYNRGMSGLDKALKNQKVNSFYDLYLNRETYRYVLRILALKLIMENPQAYGFVVGTDDRYQPYTAKPIQIDTTINDLPAFAIQQKINYKLLKIHNPWLNSDDYRLVVPKGRSYTLLIPKGEE